ncbi:pimeloyl-ACP methyl ester carboxylesterase [Mycolicibacterium sp. BK556]|uniref:alpha/beta fold hydrolase n=1 Tax=Mycobacteriaceae TaxID=1762 RepID=UPI0010DB39F9|nr:MULTISPECIES: alpha/beta hydrolase [Mycobacteriaceae]MBB3602107.1 pimeloyl-ACP methyl ester carboxylesterase [Mycolicibacterium sp. BK556]MBB3631859.1 pimeloyl-ACP methyl ester carboxylesterase [Mycolicibacterium sp. BK607]MBB3749878.1 pimeloyl-ACP methyl ester carboxylesterase [Mycolicibacterium sp. BK634]TDO18849.1 pimeloyl-ACP methyl ester carboxylesterase [Mycobacterium sp. BK086]
MRTPPARWVLLHGTPLGPAVWDAVREHLPIPSIAPDLNRQIGTGGVLQHELARAVLAEEPDGPLVVVGHSLGGQVAIEMALLAPHRLERLILVCTRDVPVPEFRDAARALRDGAPIDVEATVRRWFTDSEIADNGPVIRGVRDRLDAVLPSAYAITLEALATYDRRAQAALVATPAALLCGRLDRGCTPQVMSTLATDLPNARLDIVDEWAHMSPFVDPSGFAHRLLEAATQEI